jgi:hypothetical protein
MKLATRILTPLLLAALAGCGAKGRAGIPVEAERVAQGKGGLVYKVTAGGEAYVLDVSDNKIVWSGSLREGDTFTLTPEADRVAIDIQTVAEPDLDKDHRYSLYLRRD